MTNYFSKRYKINRKKLSLCIQAALFSAAFLFGGTGAYAANIEPSKGESIYTDFAFSESETKDDLGAYTSSVGGVTSGIFGSGSYVGGVRSGAFGDHALVFCNGGYAIGSFSQANAINSVAIGNNSIADEENTISFGHSVSANAWVETGDTGTYLSGKTNTLLTRRLVNVSDGINDHDVTTLGQVRTLIAASSGSSYTAGNGITISDDNTISISNAIGSGARVVDAHTFTPYAIGEGAKALGDASLAFGSSSLAKEYGSVSIGANSNAREYGSISIGYGTYAFKQNAIAIGYNSVALDENVVSFGHGQNEQYNGNTIYDGEEAIYRRLVNVANGVNDHDVTTLSQVKTLISDSAYTAGPGILISKDKEISISTILGKNNTIGSNAVSTLFLFGNNNKFGGYDSVAVGFNADIEGSKNYSLGGNNMSRGQLNILIGDHNVSGNPDSTRGYYRNSSIASSNVLIGSNNQSLKDSSIILGMNSRVNGVGSVAIGKDSVAEGTDIVSFGHNIGDSIANSTTNETYTDEVYRRLINVADGKNNHDVTTLGQVKSLIAASAGTGTGSSYTIGKGLSISEDNTLSVSNVIGTNSTTGYDNSLILGDNTTIVRDSSDAGGQIAIGHDISISSDNKSENPRSNGADNSNTAHSIVFGDNGVSGEENTISIGYGASSTALNSFAIGTNASSSGENAISLGEGATATFENAIAFGAEAQSTAEGAVSMGILAKSTGKFGLTNGYMAIAEGESATALGSDAHSGKKFATSIGAATSALGESSLAMGHDATASSYAAIAIGNGAFANGAANANTLAIGNGASVGTTTNGYGETIALGASSKVNNYFSTALGNFTYVTGQNSVALGYDSRASDTYEVSLGHKSTDLNASGTTYGSDLFRKITNMADGVTDHDAATLGQVKEMIKPIGQIAFGDNNLISGGTVYEVTNRLSNTLADHETRLTAAVSSIAMINNTIDSLRNNVSKINNSNANFINTLKNSLKNSVNTDFSNLTSDGKAQLRYLIKQELENQTAASTNSVSSPTSATTQENYRGNFMSVITEPQAIAKAALDFSSVDNVLSPKSNQTDLDSLSKIVENKADLSYVNSKLSEKADKSALEALSNDVVSNTKDIASNTKAIKANTEAITNLKDTKADKDGSNIDVTSWSQKLDTGEIKENNAGLVSGDKVYTALDEAKKDANAYTNAVASNLSSEFKQQMGSLESRMNQSVNRGVAGASALAALKPLDYDAEDKFNFAVGYGRYRGANATALGAFYYFNANTMLNLGATLGNGSPALNMGLSFRIGHGSVYNGVSKTQLAESNARLQETVESQDERIQRLENLVNTLLHGKNKY